MNRWKKLRRCSKKQKGTVLQHTAKNGFDMKGFNRMRVVGDSMYPTIQDRNIVYTRPYFFWERMRVGDIIVLRDPRKPSRKILKRVAHYDQEKCIVWGDNHGRSTDSRTFGPVERTNVIGKVVR